MAKRRPVGNPLALAVLNALEVRPMHPYEIATMLRATGKEQTVPIKWGSLYTVVRNLERHGLIAATGTDRRGGRPERTVYEITDAGRAEARDWLRELIGEPRPEYPSFAIGLSMLGPLHPDELVERLTARLAALESAAAAARAELAEARAAGVPRLFLVENEYLDALRAAEITWIRGLLADMESGALPEMEQWRAFHETGRMPEELSALLKEAMDHHEPPR
ncbi:PadR family transcriptional regulator [Actinomadura kijaniata]|uniref:PadR family transcriptional regulator n=1 Tax=Actinomadura kijaniata TaxID=46161 RepID=UPI003F1BE0E1